MAEEHGEKIKHLVAPEPPSRKAHPLADLVQNALLLQVGCYQRHFAQPGRGRSLRFRSGLDTDRSIGDTVHVCLIPYTCSRPSRHRAGTQRRLSAVE
jgi:hypothetical protein